MKRKLHTYLVGAMESCTDNGVGWRQIISESLKDLPLEIADPTTNEAEKVGYELAEAKQKLFGWKRSGNWDEFNKAVDSIIKMDLDFVRKADFIIAYLKPGQVIGGTMHELSLAWNLKIPVFCFLDGRKSDLNSWTLRLVNKHGEFFKTWSDLEARVRKEFK